MTEGAVATAPARRALATALPALGVALIWAFLALFLVYPLLRVFYDAFSDEAGRLTLANFTAFAGDAFYRRSLWNSLVLGAGTVAATSVLGFAIALLLVRYDFPGRGLLAISRSSRSSRRRWWACSASPSSWARRAPSTSCSRTGSGWRSRSTSSTACTACCWCRRCTSFR